MPARRSESKREGESESEGIQAKIERIHRRELLGWDGGS
jgi:hypothetical protein